MSTSLNTLPALLKALTVHVPSRPFPHSVLRRTTDLLATLPSRDPEQRFIIFLITAVIDDIFYNLVGDFPYEDPSGEPAYEFRSELFANVAQLLVQFGSTLETDSPAEHYSACVTLVNSYLDGIRRLRELTSTHR